MSVTRLASEQAKLGHEVTLACLDYPHLGPKVPAPGVRVVAMRGNAFTVRGRGWSPGFRRFLRQEAQTADIVHNHGLWMWPNAYARQAAVEAGKPLVISPRGMLEAWSLNRSKLRKAVAWRLFESTNLQAASLFHATAESEAESIQRVLGRLDRRAVPVVVAPNGVDVPELAPRPGVEELTAKFPVLRGKKWVVFLSRIHPKKGLDVLLRAWARVASSKTRELGDVVLVIAGPDRTGYLPKLKQMAATWGISDSVVFLDGLYGVDKDALLANAACAVLPSYSENFGIAAAEAMAWARPVIVSTGAPWQEVAECGAGWWVAPEEDALGRALSEALEMDEAGLDAMGVCGRRLVAERYGWSVPAGRLVRAYEQIVR